MNAKKAWVSALNIQDNCYNRWLEFSEGEDALTYWCLKNGHIEIDEYFLWAKSYFGLPIVKKDFLETITDFQFWKSIKDKPLWRNDVLPFHFWDNTYFIACVEPVEEEFPESYQLILAHPEFLIELKSKLKTSDTLVHTQSLEEDSTKPSNEMLSGQKVTYDINIASDASSESLDMYTASRSPFGDEESPDNLNSIASDASSESLDMYTASRSPFGDEENPDNLNSIASDASSESLDMYTASRSPFGDEESPDNLNSIASDASSESLDMYTASRSPFGDEESPDNLNSIASDASSESLDMYTASRSPFGDEESPDNLNSIASDASSESLDMYTASRSPFGDEEGPDNLNSIASDASSESLDMYTASRSPFGDEEGPDNLNSIVSDASSESLDMSTIPPLPTIDAEGSANLIEEVSEITPPPLTQPSIQKEPYSFEEMFKDAELHFQACMILSFSKGHASPLYWNSSWPVQPQNSSSYSTDEAGVFRIVVSSGLSYHGYIVENEVNNNLFKGLGYQSLPEHLTICPIKDNGQIYHLFLAVGSKECSSIDILKFIEKKVEKIFLPLNIPKSHAA